MSEDEPTKREEPAPADPADQGDQAVVAAGPSATQPPPPTPSGGHPHDPHAGRFGEPGRPFHRNPFNVGFLGGLGLLLAYGVFTGLRNAASILVLIFVALFLAVGLNPAVTRLRQWGMPRGFAVLTVTIGILLLFCGGLFALIPPLITQTGELINNAPDFIRSLQRNQAINDLVERYDVVQRVQGALNAGTVTNALGGVVGGARLLFGTIFNVLTVLVLTIYFMAAFDRIKRAGYRLVPASRRERVELLGDEILAKVGAYMVGALAIAVLAGVSTFVFALIVGLAYPFALAVVVAITDLIPQIGATLGAVIISIVGFATSLTAGIACVIFFLIYQQVENYLIYPKVMKRSVEVSDVAAVVAALVGVGLFGVLGALIAIPMVAGVQLILREVVNPSMDRR
ncbi:AI-2E family transporter [Spirilliplanes yamanashiensis]|uniref:AI-2E family transporter n=1 Tax=Spirilliplanes yamanashiensis TaxID=42233 RepID=A0A8J3Y4M8_9ACTN|nr:AI-2E family transporter [Spirilliplanes yamanashiensis]MDP9819881.1 putative PurR-regulated permease PerM [Spirilliplanes yamanashiensis]GIJ01300.1 AI-2E family transporter [Spirilliplanes yamanashiensis]